MRGRIIELAFISLFLVACSATPAASVPEATANTETVATQAATDIPVATEVATTMPEAANPTPMVDAQPTPVGLDAPEATALAAITIAELPVVTPDNSMMASPLGDVAMVALGGDDAAGQFFASIVMEARMSSLWNEGSTPVETMTPSEISM